MSLPLRNLQTTGRPALRPRGVQTAIVPDLRHGLSWWRRTTGLRPFAFGRWGDVMSVELSSGHPRSTMYVVSGPGADEYRDADPPDWEIPDAGKSCKLLDEFFSRASRNGSMLTDHLLRRWGHEAVAVTDPWGNSVYCLATGKRLLPLTMAEDPNGSRI